MSYSFLSNYCNSDPFLHYKTRVTVCMVLGRGVWLVVVFRCPLLLVFAEGGGFCVGESSVCSYQMLLDSSVCIATRFGPDGPGIEFRWGRDFPHLSRLALGPTQPPV